MTDRNFWQRMNELQRLLYMSPEALCVQISYKYKTYQKKQRIKSRPPVKLTSALLDTYPNLRRNWLLRGQGAVWEQPQSCPCVQGDNNLIAISSQVHHAPSPAQELVLQEKVHNLEALLAQQKEHTEQIIQSKNEIIASLKQLIDSRKFIIEMLQAQIILEKSDI